MKGMLGANTVVEENLKSNKPGKIMDEYQFSPKNGTRNSGTLTLNNSTPERKTEHVDKSNIDILKYQSKVVAEDNFSKFNR